MPDFTTDTERPEIPEDSKLFDRMQVYIEHTKGLWVRKNRQTDSLEIWFDGKFMASWAGADIIDNRLTTLIRYGFELGEVRGKADNQKALRSALGLT